MDSRILQLRYPQASFDSDVRIGRWVVLRTRQDSKTGSIRVGRGCDIQDGARLETWGGSIELKENTFVGPYVVIYGHGGVQIGRNCLISMHSRVLSSNHTIPPIGVSIRSQPDVLQPTVIGDDVWLGAGVTVLGGCTFTQVPLSAQEPS